MHHADQQKSTTVNYKPRGRFGGSNTSNYNVTTEKTENNKKCPICGCKIPNNSDNCKICSYDFKSRSRTKNNHEPPSNNTPSINIPVIQKDELCCPNCNKKQDGSNKLCEICGCGLDIRDFDFDKKISLENILKSGVDIPQDKRDIFLNDEYYNSPIYCASLEDYYKSCVDTIKSEFSNGSVLFVSLNRQIISKITELLRNEGYREYINNDLLFKENYLLIHYDSIINYLDKLDEFNNYFADKFSIKLPNTIDSMNKFIGLIKYNNVKYLADEDLIKLNEFIKIYWDYWKFISFKDMDLSSLKVYGAYIEKLNNFKEIYAKYFEKSEFDVHVLSLIKRLNLHISFTEIVDKLKINGKNIDNLDSDLLKNDIEQLEILINEIELKMKKIYSGNDLNKSFNELRVDLLQKRDMAHESIKKSIILMNLDDALILFDNSDIFDNVIFDDSLLVNGEARLHLFLISKNKLSSVKLWYGGYHDKY